MNYRFLEPEEFAQVIPAYQEQNVPPPKPTDCFISGAFEGGKVVGFLVFRPVYHSEPIWVDPAYRGKVSIPRLAGLINAMLPKGSEYYAFAPNSRIEHLGNFNGLETLDWRVMRKRI